ncbi:MAG TPA: hypothetical protein PKC79_18125 [Solidesulfovibrio magneticus]|nr:hypothetical protein [Solidesulfovibrio magneticus]
MATRINPATMSLIAEVLNERLRQQEAVPDLAERYQRGEQSQAAASLILEGITRRSDELHQLPPPGFPGSSVVPWPLDADNPRADLPVRDGFVAAMAMLLGEVEHLDRMVADGALVFCAGGHLVWRDEAAVDVEGNEVCPACAAERKIAYVHEPDTVARFLRARCERASDSMVPVKDLYAAYEKWFFKSPDVPSHLRKLSLVAFCKSIAGTDWIKERRAFGSAYWIGLRLREEV